MFDAFKRIGILQMNSAIGGMIGKGVIGNVFPRWIRADILSALVAGHGFYLPALGQKKILKFV
jgi:hypothetical protein